MNVVTIIGRITSDLELRKVGASQDLTVLSFSIAYNERRGGKEESYFFDITAWNKQAETIAEYFKKGQRIGVTGRLRQERWKDDSGNNRSRISIVLNEFYFIEPKGYEGSPSQPESSGNNNHYGKAPKPSVSTEKPKKKEPDAVSFEEVSSDFLDDEVPF